MSDPASSALNGHAAEVVNLDDPHAHLAGDSATTQAELVRAREADDSGPPRKKTRTDAVDDANTSNTSSALDTRKGQAPVKSEYLVNDEPDVDSSGRYVVDDDAAEGRDDPHAASSRNDRKGGKKNKKNRGQNKDRKFGTFGDRRGLCSTRTFAPELSPDECSHGDKCKFEHDLRKYLSEHKQSDLETLGKACPAFEFYGRCPAGFKCRFLGSHMGERELEDGRKELYLIEDADKISSSGSKDSPISQITNDVPFSVKVDLQKRKIKTPKADKFIDWAEKTKGEADGTTEILDNRAAYVEGSLRPSEKRKLYFGRDTPALAPLTTQGNLPYRRLCVDLGAQLTYSEMAMSVPLVNGHKPEWALIRAHESEAEPPKSGESADGIIQGYENAKDSKFAAQISGNKPWNVTKATEILTMYCPSLRLVDVNCGCPIDLVYDHGAGSALMNYPGKLEKMIMGMNAVSGEVPITCKIRMGTKDKEPTAIKLVNRLVYGSVESRKSSVDHEGRTSGVAAITLHGRSRQQRYSRSADWSYIAECAAVIKRYHEEGDDVADTVREPDPRDQAADGKVFFLGNGDCYSHIDYYRHLDEAGVDSVMIARGALVKPWLFEEIEKQQYLDKSASERLGYVEKFVRYGMDNWGTDEIGISTTRRFLLEWLSFAYRYVPIGILEHLPPSLQDRPPKYRGRNDMETLLASDNYKDWIKISEMYLGPAADGFRFQPKHKSNSYEYNAEG